MASIHKRPGRSRFYWAAYYREDGRRAQRSTKTTDRKRALRIANDLEDAHQRKLTEGQMRRVLSDLNERLVGQPLASASLKDFAASWLKRKKGKVETVTFQMYQGALADFVDALPSKAGLGLQYVTVADIASWRDKCAAKATPRTANNKLKIVRTFFQTAWRDGYITENPAARVGTLATADSTRRPFTLSELKQLLAIANDEWRGMILAGLYTGQRLKDIASLTWANVDLERKEIALSTSKTGRRQIIPIAKPLLAHLATMPAGDDPRAPLFPTAHPYGMKPGGKSHLSQGFYELLVDANLATARLPKRKSLGVGRAAPRKKSEITFHCLRHTATSLLKNAGVSEAVARDLIGHDSAEVSQQYTHIDAESKRAAVELLPDVTDSAKGRK